MHALIGARVHVPWMIPNLLLHDKPVPLSDQRALGFTKLFVYCSNPNCHHNAEFYAAVRRLRREYADLRRLQREVYSIEQEQWHVECRMRPMNVRKLSAATTPSDAN